MIRPHGAVLSTRMGIVEILTELSKAVCLLKKIQTAKGNFIIETNKKEIKNTSLKKKTSKSTTKTKIIVKEHFAEQGKNLEELLTDIIVEKAKRISM